MVRRILLGTIVVLLTAYAFAQTTVPFTLIDSNPQRNAAGIAIDQSIRLEFNESLDPSTVANCLSVTSNLRGQISGITTSQDKALVFKPGSSFSYGEEITVTVLQKLKSVSAHVLTNPASFRFTIIIITSPSQPPAFYDHELLRQQDTNLHAISATDMDSDGDVDLVYAGNANVSWMENTGAGNYTTHLLIERPSFMYEARPIDIDLDGDMDILTATIPHGIDLLINNGMEEFTLKPLSGEAQALSLDVADFDGNGLIDIVYSDIIQGIDKTFVLLNQGSSVYTKAKVSDTRAYKNRIADLDNDGDWDIVQHETSTIRYLINEDMAFTTHDIVGGYIYDFAISDFDDDNDIDIVVSNDGTLAIYINIGSLQFTVKDIESDQSYSIIGSGDFDGDHDVDLILPDNANFKILVNDGSNLFTSEKIQNSHSPVTLGFTPLNMGTADMDRDGDLDFYSVTSYLQIKWYENVSLAKAYPFSALKNNLKPFDDGDADWGDFDNDGDLDLIIIGISDNKATTALYENRDGFFKEKSTSLPGVYGGSSDWGDYDNDGDLDLLLMGGTINTNGIDYRNPITVIYTNNNGIFVQLPSSAAQLPKANLGKAQWADFNNDGWLDIVINAYGTSGIYQSDGKGNFSKKLNLSFEYGTFACADYDHDGDLDLAISGALTYQNTPLLEVFRNDGDWVFAEAQGDFIGCIGGNLSWTDIDNDGDVDLVAAGGKPSGGASIAVYENKGPVFKALTNTDPLFYIDPYGTASTGDFDNDGKSDLISSGLGEIYLLKNEGSGDLKFQDIELPAITTRIANWGDYDQDHDLDIFVESGLLRNNNEKKNTPPTPPSTIQVDSVFNNTVFLHWTEGNDLENGSSGLSYQIYMGTQSKRQNIVNSNSNLSTGLRKIAESGTTKGRNTRVENLNGGSYFLGVQSVDAAFEGSAFSTEVETFVIRIDGTMNVCKGSDFSYVATPAGNYSWQVTGGTIVSGQGTDALVVNWNTIGKGYIKVSNSQNVKNSVVVSINETPKPVIEGDSTVCMGIEYYAITDTNTYFTDWTVEGVNSILEDTTHLAKIDWTSPNAFKVIAKAYSEHKGCFAVDTLLVKVDIKPITSFTGPNLTCTNQIDLYTTTAANQTWEITKGTIVADSAKLVRVKWQSVPGLGSVVLRESSYRGYCISSDSMAVGIYSYPAKPVLLVMGDTILSSPSPSKFYKWYYNDELIFSGPYNGVISQVAGYFMVEVFNEVCGTKSDPIGFQITGIGDSEVSPNSGSLLVHPNPADQRVIVELTNEYEEEIEVSIYSITNSLVRRIRTQKSDQTLFQELDVSELSSGLYILMLKSDNHLYTTKFIKR